MISSRGRGSKDNDDVLLVTGVGVLMSSVAPPPSPTSPCYGREVVVKRRERHGITIAAAEGEGSEAAEAVVHNEEEEEEEREEEIKALYENADVVIRGRDWKYRIEGGCSIAQGTYNGEVVQYVLPGVNWNIIGTLRGDKTLLVKVAGRGER